MRCRSNGYVGFVIVALAILIFLCMENKQDWFKN